MTKNKKYLNKYSYKCKDCRKERRLTLGLRIDIPTVFLPKYFRCIYKWCENVPEKNVLRNCEISKSTYQKIKSNIHDFIETKDDVSLRRRLGGPGLKVQVDETAIAHGDLPACPSQMDDDFPGIRWLVGMIEEGSRDFRYFIVPNRTQETFSALFLEHIESETVIITDGHASYPGAVRNNRCLHQIVNHSRGFKNVEGFHTNNIENLWSLLKYERTKRRGVLKVSLTTFLKEFRYRYQYMRSSTSVEISAAFNDILSYLFSQCRE